MDCRRVDAILNGHAQASLDPAEEAQVAAHLEACRRCAEAWRGYQLATGEVPEVPRDGLYAAVRAQALGVSSQPVRRAAARWWLPAAGLAATAVLVLAVAGVFRPAEDAPDAVSVPAATADADTPRKTEMPALPLVVREFTAGVHYQELPTPVPTSTGANGIEVCEFFMFPCPHCFNLEPLLEDWAARQPDDVTLVRVPVFWNDSAQLQAQAFYTAEALGRLDDLIEPMFEAIHIDGNRLDSAEKIRSLFVEHGVSAEEFDSAFGSRQVAAGMRGAEELNRQYAIDSTPTVAVNGKYVTGPAMAGSYEAVFDVVDALVESERVNPALLPAPNHPVNVHR